MNSDLFVKAVDMLLVDIFSVQKRFPIKKKSDHSSFHLWLIMMTSHTFLQFFTLSQSISSLH